MDFEFDIGEGISIAFGKAAALDMAAPSIDAPLSIEPEVTKLNYTDYKSFRKKI